MNPHRTGYYLIQPGSLANLLIMNGLPWNLWDERVQWAVLYSENCVLFVFVLYMGAPSGGIAAASNGLRF